MLRLWDCFLFEGPKVLFRFTVVLLGLYEDEILERTDTISVMKVLKAAVRHTYDVEGLIKVFRCFFGFSTHFFLIEQSASDDLNPFPSRAFLLQRQALYLKVLQERLKKRLELRNIAVDFGPVLSDDIADFSIEVIEFSPFDDHSGYAFTQHLSKPVKPCICLVMCVLEVKIGESLH